MPRLSCEFALALNIDCLKEVSPQILQGQNTGHHHFQNVSLENCHLCLCSECPDGSAQVKLTILFKGKQEAFFATFWGIVNKTLHIVIHPPPPSSQLGKIKHLERTHLIT